MVPPPPVNGVSSQLDECEQAGVVVGPAASALLIALFASCGVAPPLRLRCAFAASAVLSLAVRPRTHYAPRLSTPYSTTPRHTRSVSSHFPACEQVLVASVLPGGRRNAESVAAAAAREGAGGGGGGGGGGSVSPVPPVAGVGAVAQPLLRLLAATNDRFAGGVMSWIYLHSCGL